MFKCECGSEAQAAHLLLPGLVHCNDCGKFSVIVDIVETDQPCQNCGNVHPQFKLEKSSPPCPVCSCEEADWSFSDSQYRCRCCGVTMKVEPYHGEAAIMVTSIPRKAIESVAQNLFAEILFSIIEEEKTGSAIKH